MYFLGWIFDCLCIKIFYLSKRVLCINREEFFVVVYGCERFNYYIYGRLVDVMLDYKLFVLIIKKLLVSMFLGF